MIETPPDRATEDGHAPTRERLPTAVGAALGELGETSGGHPRHGLRTVSPAEVLNAATEGDG